MRFENKSSGRLEHNRIYHLQGYLSNEYNQRALIKSFNTAQRILFCGHPKIVMLSATV